MVEDNKDDILTIDQTAQLLKVSSRTIYDLVSEERITGKIFAKKVGRSWRIMRREINNFLSGEQKEFHQMTLSQTEAKRKSG